MPQSGIHGLVGLATARSLIRRVPLSVQTGFVFGTVLGAVLPDIDMYPTAIAVLVTKNSDVVYDYHRTAAHSIFVVLLFAIFGLFMKSKPAWRWIWWGLAIGTLTHEVLDIFFWFAQIDIMWPLSHFPSGNEIFQPINIWNDDYDGVISNIRDACEFGAFALFLYSIRKIVLGQRGPGKDLKIVKRWEIALWISFAVALVTAFVFLEDTDIQQKIVNVPYLLAFLPYCWSRVWVYRREITRWCQWADPAELALDRRLERQRWHDWDETVGCNALSIEMPRSEDEVVSIVQRAIKNSSNVRVFGAGHSWSPLVPTDGTLINLDQLASPVVIDEASGKATLHAGMRLRDAGPLLQKHHLTMRNLGAITPQSIAGAMGSGTHGTGVEYGVIGTQVSAMKIVDGRGDLREFNVADHPREMTALRLSLGCLGVIVEVTIDCVPDHHVELVQYPMEYDEFLARFDELYQTNERVRAYWFPGSKRVFVNTMNTTTKPLTPGPVFSWTEAVLVRRYAMGALWGLGRAVKPLIPVCNRIEEFAGYRNRPSKVGLCFDAITTPIPPFHQEAEVAVPIADGRKAVEEYGRLVKSHHISVNVESEIRFSKADDVLLSPSYKQDVCYIGGYTSTYRFNDPFFEMFCTDLRTNFGGRPHWGKIGAPKRAEAQLMFPGFGEFEKIRKEFDPSGVFANDYIKELFAL